MEIHGRFVDWLFREAIAEARGDRFQTLTVRPDGRLWLGRVASQERVERQRDRLGDRGERLDPCEVGVRVRPSAVDGRVVACRVRFVAWREVADGGWEKTRPVEVAVEVTTPTEPGEVRTAGRDKMEAGLTSVGAQGLAAEVHAELEPGKDGLDLVVTVVNVSPAEVTHLDTNLYEVELEVDLGETEPFVLEGLTDSFRYDRRVAAYGVNSGVRVVRPGTFVTTDFAVHDKKRPVYWDEEISGPPPDLTFARLAREPVTALNELASALQGWTSRMWSDEELEARREAEGWEDATAVFARSEAHRARSESERVRRGVELVAKHAELHRAFSLANRAFQRAHDAGAIVHTAWRPFQLGFVLANVSALAGGRVAVERELVDILWFQTGGGKTETYLLFVVIAAFYDRLTGKRQGVTSWARFPLRMLSLDQTQRFADVFAAAELVRSEERIGGDPFSVGFLVGEDGTPNRMRRAPRPGDGSVDIDDPEVPRKYRVLLRCPFCQSEDHLIVRFDEARWALDHVCRATGCPWQGRPLPFRIVDEEIYRWLPTVVLGTLDKAASVSMQAAMRGFYGAPLGVCPEREHGFTYAPRSSTRGCLVPGCTATPAALPQSAERYGPTIRMQDELHLLRDSLGSVAAHYEALLDHLQRLAGSTPKVIASSATLAGHEEQVRELYRRGGRTFPVAGPRTARSFWFRDSELLARRYVGLAPRGVTLEYANEQLVGTMQRLIRAARDDPAGIAEESGVPPQAIPELISLYGVNVVYGTTLKDVEAAARSFEAQPDPGLNPITLTGRTPLEEVRSALHRLKKPEANFDDRIHLIAASSMLSHGVDIDRLNVMIMWGLPLSTAEFIQTTARIGRSYPGIVFVLHKIARERDAGVFRAFRSFVEHADRLIDPVPITSKSRRILELTFAGLEQGRIYGVHEPRAVSQRLQPLTLPARLHRAFDQMRVTEAQERHALVEMLAVTGPLDENLRRDIEDYVRGFFRGLRDPGSTARWVADLFPTGPPMRSLRDVEAQVAIYNRGGTP